MGVVLRANPVRGESHIQRYAAREVATVKNVLKFLFTENLTLSWNRGGQIAARGSNVACHSFFSGPRGIQENL